MARMQIARPSTSKVANKPVEKPVETVTETVEPSEQEKALIENVLPSIENRAKRFAAKLDADENFANDFAYVGKSIEVSKRGAFIVFLDMLRVLGDMANELPKPDSEGGNNPDKYKKDGDKRTYSFYNEMYDDTARGFTENFIIRQCELASDKDTIASAEEKYKQMGAEELAKTLANAKARRTYGRKLIKDGASIIYQLNAIKELDTVIVQYPETVDEIEEQERSTVAPFVIRDAELMDIKQKDGTVIKAYKYPDKVRVLSVPQFLNLDVEKAKDKGGTWLALLESGKSQRKTGGETNQTGTVEETETELAVDAETFADVTVKYGNFLRKIQEDAKSNARMLSRLNSQAGEGLFYDLGQIYLMLDGWYGKPEMMKRLEKMESEISADGKKAAA